MHLNRISWNIILGYTLLLVFDSCKGQNSSINNDNQEVKRNFDAKGDTLYSLGKHIMVVYQDKNNIYWFGSNGEGVYRYDDKNIIHYTTKHGLCNNNIRSIEEDKTGNMYFNTDGGISKFNGDTFETLLPVKNDPFQNWKLQPDDLWFKAPQDSGILYRYDGKELFRLKFPKTKEGEEFMRKFPRAQFPSMTFNPYDVYTIYKDKNGSIWFGTSSLGACRYDGNSWIWFSYEELSFQDPSYGMRSILEDKNGKFWFSNTVNRFSFISNKNPDTGITLQKEIGITETATNNNGAIKFYLTATEDNSGDLWFVTYKSGVWRYNGKNLKQYILKDDDKPITLFSVYKDNAGLLWIGTHENGVYKFNGENFERFKP